MNGQNNNAAMFTGFFFRKRNEPMDWRRFASVDVDAIVRHLDFAAMQENVMNVAFCDVEAEFDTRHVDPNLVKVVKLAQLMIEYLLHCQDYMTTVVSSLEEKSNMAQEEVKELRKRFAMKQEQTNDLKRECHRRKKLLIAQQRIMESGPQSHNQCAFCSKAFINPSYLQAHVIRRHEDQVKAWRDSLLASSGIAARPGESGGGGLGQSTEGQLKELLEYIRKEKLSNSATAVHHQKSQYEMDARLREELHQEHHEQIEGLKRAFRVELDQMRMQYEQTRRELEDLKRVKQDVPRWGNLEDDDVSAEKTKPARDADEELFAAEKGRTMQERPKTVAPPAPKQSGNGEAQKSVSNNAATLTATQRSSTDKKIVRISDEKPQVSGRDEADYDDESKESSDEEEPRMTSALKPSQQSSFSSSFDMNQVRTSRLLEELHANPETLRRLRKELLSLLDDQLADRGIPRGTTRITSTMLHDKLSGLGREREQLMAKYVLFDSIRQGYLQRVEKEARQDLRASSQSLDRHSESSASRIPFTYSQTPSAQRRSDTAGGLRSSLTGARTRGDPLHSTLPTRSPQRTPQKPVAAARGVEESYSESESQYDEDVQQNYSQPQKSKPQPKERATDAASISPRKPRSTPTQSISSTKNSAPRAAESPPVVSAGTAPRSVSTPSSKPSTAVKAEESSDDWDEDSEERTREAIGNKMQKLDLKDSMHSNNKPPGKVQSAPVRGTDNASEGNSDSESWSHPRVGAELHVDSSNTFGTSQWQNVSKPVSTVNAGVTQKSHGTNQSSDIGVEDVDFDSQ